MFGASGILKTFPQLFSIKFFDFVQFFGARELAFLFGALFLDIAPHLSWLAARKLGSAMDSNEYFRWVSAVNLTFVNQFAPVFTEP